MLLLSDEGGDFMEPYKRVVIKVSGEALGDEQGKGLNFETIHTIAEQLVALAKLGCEICIVVGAGNIWRGRSGKDMDRTTADHMGMLATAINALALQDIIESKGLPVRVQTAIEMKEIAEPYIRRRAIRHLEKGRIVIFACGLGSPFFSTDTAAALRAAEMNAEVILLAKNVDGVYDSDPRINPSAKKYDTISYQEILQKNLTVMDSPAVALCMENNIPLLVFPLKEKNSIIRAACKESIGTIVHA